MTAPVYIPKAMHNGKGQTMLDPGNAGSINVDRTPAVVPMVSAGAETRTLARPVMRGDIVTLYVETYVGNITLTVTGGYNTNGDTSFTFSAAGQWAVFVSGFDGTNYFWMMVANYQLGNLSATELGWLDGVTAGTAAASKAMVTNSSNQIGSLAALAIGAAIPTNPQSLLAVIPGANASGVTANQSYYHAEIAPSGAVTIPTGTAPVVASLLVAEPNITATGTVTRATSLYVSGAPTEGGTANYAAWIAGVTRVDGNIDLSSAAADIIGKANTAAMVRITDGTTALWSADSRNTIKNVSNVTLTGVAPTIASEAAAHINATLNIAPKTITYTGGTGTTSSLGAQLYIDAPTFTDSSVMTLTTVSSVHIATVAAAGGSLTISNSRMISTGVSDCYLTNGGVWTDTACWGWGKQAVVDAAGAQIDRLVHAINPKTWLYREDVHGDDHGRERVGVLYDELPDELRAPGQERGVSAGLLASFCLAGLRRAYDRIAELEAKLAAAQP